MIEQPTIAPLEPEKIAGTHGDYFDGIFQVPPVVCGLPLKPLSITRYRLMAWRGVAFAAEEERTATAGDLLMGVLICSMTVKDFKAFAASPGFQSQVQKWGRNQGFFEPKPIEWTLNPRIFFCAPINWAYRKLFPDQYDMGDLEYLTGEMKRFQDYIKAGSKAPEFWDESQDCKVSAAHWSQSIEVVLRGNLGWTQEEIDEEPLGKALQDYFKYMENQGLVRLMSAEEARDLSTPLTAEEAAEANAQAIRTLAIMHGEIQPEAANGK